MDIMAVIITVTIITGAIMALVMLPSSSLCRNLLPKWVILKVVEVVTGTTINKKVDSKATVLRDGSSYVTVALSITA